MYPRPDVVGKHMPDSRLTVTRIKGKDQTGRLLYSTICDCGGPHADRVVAKAWHLLHGRPNSCGYCRDRYPLIGVKKGEIKVIDITNRTYKESPLYEMHCSCGKVLFWRSCQLTRSDYPTCGKTECRAKNPKGWVLPFGRAAFNRLRARVKKHAEDKGLVYELSDDELWSIMTKPCAFCGVLPFRHTRGSSNGHFKYSGVDRWNNELGYVTGNVVPCCTPCNLMKGPIGGEVFLKIVGLILNRHGLTFAASEEEMASYTTSSGVTSQSRRIPTVDRRWINRRPKKATAAD